MASFFHSCRMHVDASREIVWNIVADPSCWPEVNKQICRVEQLATRPVEVGETFTVTTQFESGDPLRRHDWCVAEVEPPSRVVYVFREQGTQTDFDQLTFIVEEQANGTLVSCHLPPVMSWRTIVMLLFFVTPAQVVRDSFLKGIRQVASKRQAAGEI